MNIYKDLDGWEITTDSDFPKRVYRKETGDYGPGPKWGVMIRRQTADGVRRNGVRLPPEVETEREALDRALPVLAEWARTA